MRTLLRHCRMEWKIFDGSGSSLMSMATRLFDVSRLSAHELFVSFLVPRHETGLSCEEGSNRDLMFCCEGMYFNPSAGKALWREKSQLQVLLLLG